MDSSTLSMGFEYTEYGLQVHRVLDSSRPSMGIRYTKQGLQIYQVWAKSTTSMVTWVCYLAVTWMCVTSSSGKYKCTEYGQRYKYPKYGLQTPSIHYEYYV